jgi:curved DNA-binding protein CbpA
MRQSVHAIQKAYDVLSNTEKRIDYLISQAINEGRPPVIAQAKFSIESLQAIQKNIHLCSFGNY